MKKNKEYIEFPFYYNEKILNTDILELNLSVRSNNGLRRSQIHTIGELIENWDKLPGIKHFGIKSVKETRSALFNYNIERMDDEHLSKFLELFRYRKEEKKEDEYYKVRVTRNETGE